MTFSTKYKQERVFLGFDFSNRLDSGETISNATFYNKSVENVDAGASAMLSGSSIISGGIVKILVINGITGNTYELGVVVITSGGRTLYAKSDYKVL